MKKAIITLVITSFASVSFGSAELNRLKELNNAQNYESASNVAYRILNNSRYRKEQSEIAYELAKSFEGLGLKQVAVFNLFKAVKSAKGRSIAKYLDKLSELALEVGDESGLNYALSKINIKRFPKAQKPILYFRFGQAYLKVGRFKKAIAAFLKIPKNHPLYFKSRYFLGLAYSENGNLRSSYRAFTQAANIRAERGVADKQRVAALMGRARVLYHMKNWEKSLEAYKGIPRDSTYFHDMLFESSWAMLRAGKFRSALSNFQSLHSEYYDDYFYPEATLLRGIIYLYICKVDEVNKVLQVYDKTYGKMNTQLTNYLKGNRSFKNDVKEFLMLKGMLNGEVKIARESFQIPYVLLRHLNRSSKVSRSGDYHLNLENEKARIESNQGWSESPAGSYARSILNKRNKGSLKRLGRVIREELVRYNKELDDFGDQKELIKFELITEEKEQARKKLEGRDDFDAQVEQKTSRFTYTKNGYEYWPFQGEYWLDEIGNYHYLGASRCE